MNSVLKGASKDSIDALFQRYGSLQLFKKNSFVYMKGERPKAAYLIEKGLLKVCQLTTKGQNITFFIRKTGDAFGLAEIVLQREHPCYAQCLHDCKIWVLDSEIIEEKLNTDPQINQEILYMMTDRLIHQQSTVEKLISQPVEWRLAWLLQKLSSTVNDRTGWFDMMLTHEEISNVIGCSRQTVSKLLSRWRSQGIIDYSRKGMIDLDLHRILQDES